MDSHSTPTDDGPYLDPLLRLKQLPRRSVMTFSAQRDSYTEHPPCHRCHWPPHPRHILASNRRDRAKAFASRFSPFTSCRPARFAWPLTSPACSRRPGGEGPGGGRSRARLRGCFLPVSFRFLILVNGPTILAHAQSAGLTSP